MSRHPSALRVLATAAGLSLLPATAPLQAAVTPITSTARAHAYALASPNPDHPGDVETDSAASGDFFVDAQQLNQSPGLSCEVISDTTAHVDADGAAGSATIDVNWIAIDTLPPNSPGNFGVFGADMKFSYSFTTDAAATVTISVTTNSNVSGDNPVANAMQINHYLTFNGQYTELPLTGVTNVEYVVGAGFHQMLLEHYPNSGIGPWPNANATATTVMSFEIDADDPVIVRGDMNCDGQLDFFDIDGFLLALFNIEDYYIQYPECSAFNADINNDESVDFFDIDGFLACLFGACP